MCPHIWLIRPHIWLIQILSECAPIFGLFAPIFGLFANSRNSAPIFGLFSSKFAASLFWPDGTTWYRRISTYLGWNIKTLTGIDQGKTDLSVVGRDDSDVFALNSELGGEELLDVVDHDLALLGVEETRTL